MNKIIELAVGSLKELIAVPFVLAAIIKLDASLAIKILIICAIFLSFLLLNGLNVLSKQLQRILHFQRVTFIAVEMSRLEPENIKPAQDIIIDDVNAELRSEENRDLAGGGPAVPILIGILYLGFVYFATRFILEQWNQFV